MLRTTKAVLFATLAALVAPGCSPTAPDSGELNTYVAFPTLDNATGAPTILDARLLLDGVVEAEDNETIGYVEAVLSPTDSTITAGSHTLTFLLVSQTASVPTRYTVPKFDITIFECPEGSLSDTSQFSETIHMPTQTASLAAGQSITYTFSTPDCVVPDTE
jgi:hypothetical protein